MQYKLLVIEDSDDDVRLLERALQRANMSDPFYRFDGGDDVIEFFENMESSDDLVSSPIVLLDLNLPGTDGHDVLSYMKHHESLRRVPVVVLTTSSSPRDIDMAYQRGANGYMVKPIDTRRFYGMIEDFVEYWFGSNASPTFKVYGV